MSRATALSGIRCPKDWTPPCSRGKYYQPQFKVIKSKFSKAFTLIELLFVIVIVAILAALLVPALSRVIENSRTTQCASNLRQIGTAMFLFAGEHGGYFPESGATIPWEGPWIPAGRRAGRARLRGWSSFPSILICL